MNHKDHNDREAERKQPVSPAAKPSAAAEAADLASPVTRPSLIILLAVIATLLWGSAFPAIKIGYELFSISAADTSAKLLFAGYRFTLSGVMTIAAAAVLNRRFMLPARKSVGLVALLGLVQTTVQYVFFYIALSNASGVKCSIIGSAGAFFTVILAHFAYRDDKLNRRKTAGCLVGFLGIILVNLNGLGDLTGAGGLGGGFSLTGEGFMLLSSAAVGVGAVISKAAAKKGDSVVVTGYQLLIGGAALVLLGLSGGGRLAVPSPAALGLLLYLALLSAVAFTLWTILLKHNPVGKIAIFNFLTPVFGVILSGIFLGESFLSVKTLGALLLVCLGIYVVEKPRTEKAVRPVK